MKEPKNHDEFLAALPGAELVDALQQRLVRFSGSKTRKLYLAIYDLLSSGYLPVETQLPASRQLARALGCGRNTVTAAYEQLADEGLLYTAQRGGVLA